MDSDLTSTQKKGSTIKACPRCHRRKQRCVGYPACFNCKAAGIACNRDSTPALRRLAGLSKEELIKKIEVLERDTLPAPGGLSDHGQSSSRRASNMPLTQSASQGLQDQAHLIDDRLMVDAVDEDSQEPEPTRAAYASDAERDPAWPTSDISVTKSSGLIMKLNEAREGVLLTAYLESMHRRTPFCDYLEIVRTLRAVAGDEIHSLPCTMQLFRLYMACAIGAGVRQLSGRVGGQSAEIYFQEANLVKRSLGSLHLAERVEMLLWVILYKLRYSYSPDMWYLIGSAMRTAVDADLHREHHYKSLDPAQAEMQRRLFWATYAIERNVCWALKKPFSLSDHDIDVQLPVPAVFQTCIDTNSESADTQLGSPRRPLDLNIYISLIKLARINSRTFKLLYPCGEDLVVTEEVTSNLQEIRNLEATLPSCSGVDLDFLLLHTKNSVRALIEPFLPSLDMSDGLAASCLEASGAVCRLFKRLRFERGLGFSFTMIKSVFTAGVTICYILFRDPSLWTPTRANDLRACSSTLFAAAERNGVVRKYCDILETIIETVMGHVEQNSPSTYNKPADAISDSAVESPANTPMPQQSFEILSKGLRASKLDFPTRSYPSYCTEPEEWRKGCTNAWSAGLCFDPVLDFHGSSWEFLGSYNEIVDMSSIADLFGVQSGG